MENTVVLVAGREVVMCPTGHRNFQLAVTYMTGKYTGDAPMNRIGVATWDLAQAEVSHREYAIMNAETLG